MWNNNGGYNLINFSDLSKKEWDKLENKYFNRINTIEDDNFKPHYYQLDILNKYENDKFEKINHSVILPTGTGKTFLAAFMFLNYKSAFKNDFMLFTTHRTEILTNAYNRFKSICKNDDFLLVNDENINNIDSIYLKGKNLFITNKRLKNLIDKNIFSKDQFGIIFYDEAHHFDNSTNTNIFEYIYNFFKPKNNIALTATPERMSGMKDITSIFDNVLYKMSLHEAIEKNLVCDIDYYLIKDDSGITLNEADLANEMKLIIKVDNDKRNNLVLKSINDYFFDDSTTLIFCINIDHAKKINNLLINNGFKSDFLVSGDINRNIKINDFINKEINFLCVVDIFNEGIDIKEISNVIFLRPTKSKTIFTQQLGRGLRKYNNKVLKVVDIATNINIKNYWIDRFQCFMSPFNIKKLIDKNELIFKGVKLYIDRLIKEDFITLIKKQNEYAMSNLCNKFKVWPLECIDKNSGKKIKYKLIFNNNFTNWFEIFEFVNDEWVIIDIFNYDKYIYYKQSGVNFKNFNILLFLKKTKSFNDEKSEFIINNFNYIINNAKTQKISFPYNYGIKFFKDVKSIKNDTLLYKKFSNDYKAFIKKVDDGFILLKDSYIYPYHRELYSKKVVDFWDKLKIPKNHNTLFKITKDEHFVSGSLLTDVIVGGNSSINNELYIKSENLSLRDYFIKLINKKLNADF
ncbi:ATP-dependent helicase IRC3 [Spiroplasma litorale]|uniref:ATP-dependent helicase IRC3 n=1 Tax=Spiroplasma litorale TaxID=216942 RepID=A0A0K1W244_9MOLU|nr:DEAD/DEAH box helicase family protein [Spiroplasma litorale]AKX34251.1 ATP-dependent helicase IRC3 [Spiroplasma litorale]